ncbi:MAG: hypothetical protein ACTIJ6_00180 [Leucobacter sp.]
MTDENVHRIEDESREHLDRDQRDEFSALGERSEEEVETVAAIVAEVRDAAGTASADDVTDALRKRLADAGVDLPKGDIAELVTQIRTGLA